MGRAPRLRFGGTTQYLDSLLLAYKISPHAGQHIAHKIIVADRPDIVPFDSSPGEQSSRARTDGLFDLRATLPRG
jgi:hypothetical protein